MSKKNKNKIEKSLNKPCPDCGDGKLSKVVHKMVKDGVSFSEEYVECPECGYCEKLRLAKKEQRASLILRGREQAPRKKFEYKKR